MQRKNRKDAEICQQKNLKDEIYNGLVWLSPVIMLLAMGLSSVMHRGVVRRDVPSHRVRGIIRRYMYKWK